MSKPQEPKPIEIDLGTEKLQGFIMKLTRGGLLVELDRIPFKVGTYMMVSFVLKGDAVITEKVRSVKHYDKFFRSPVKKVFAQGEVRPLPKKLCEFHFNALSETNRLLISKYVLQNNVASGTK